jgi:GNAT superfamily N-acetyltransferase
MTPAVIRPVAGEDDLEAACQLLQQFFREEQFDTPPETVARHARRMYELRDHCLMLVAWAGGLPVAVATLSMDFGIEFGWQAEIGDLYVVPSARGRGLARHLVGQCIDWAGGKGAGSVAVTVTPHGADQGLDRFYRALDFQGDGRRLLWRRV